MLRTGEFRRTVDDRYDKWIFICSFAIGAVLIGLCRFFGVSSWVVIIIPTVILGLYALYAMRTARLSMSLDRAGDNIYYLGLLYTLVTLSISLVQIFDLGAGADAVFGLMSAFGIALWSTIFGMFLRVFVQQFRSDPADIEKEIRADLTEAVRSIRSELYAMTSDVNSYRRAITQSLTELQGEVTSSIREISKRSTEAVEEMAARAASSVDDTARRLSETAEALQRANAGHSNALSKTIREIDSAVSEVTARLQRFEVDSSTVSEKLATAAQSLDASAASLQERINAEKDAITALERLIAMINSATGPAVRESIEMAVASVESIGGQARTTNKALAAMEEAVEALHTQLRKAGEQDFQSIRKLVQEMQDYAKVSARSTELVQDGLLKGVKALQEEIRR
ncbi:hypothetical protein OCH7691_04585 [Oceanibacterium hippocampi]|uniref:Apolipoprotein A1/A4/E domain protein n=2 Tax=Oceanibacterium hippocampi TaxID=745714 RepID=A0A1Y5U1J2_9PROT|nr:hypothetical protein OCH7691_04585 [Oceanibacterium hippocampi]